MIDEIDKNAKSKSFMEILNYNLDETEVLN